MQKRYVECLKTQIVPWCSSRNRLYCLEIKQLLGLGLTKVGYCKEYKYFCEGIIQKVHKLYVECLKTQNRALVLQ